MATNIHLKNIIINIEKGFKTPERLLWKHLQARRLSGLHFKRRQVIEDYVIHFVCFEKKTVIEINDGQRDSEKDERLISQGFKILTFSNVEVEQNIERVLKEIREHCIAHFPLPPGQT